MKTGEGKTLVATLPAYLNSISGEGVHIVTVNDYLALRDSTLTSPIYSFLGLTTGVVTSNTSLQKRKQAYACDITYCTSNELGFDYLKDNMLSNACNQVQRGHNFVIIDEVDSVLIDEARTPLIISSAPNYDSTHFYSLFNRVITTLVKASNKSLEKGDYYIDEKLKQVHLTDAGYIKIENILIKENILKKGDSLYDNNNIIKMHYLSACLKAKFFYKLNVDYILQDNSVVIIDNNTGRPMHGRRWSDGVHQAIEAKEGVKIYGETKPLASITFQNFFKLYKKCSGMTGTADTESAELYSVYGLEVVVIPTNLPLRRVNHNDKIYATSLDKFSAIILDIKRCAGRKQPVLVGTTSIEVSELLSSLLKISNIKHRVLNAKYHENEASIISQAGYPGAVTIATNMAGRGTDIILGGNLDAEIINLKNCSDDQRTVLECEWKKNHEAVVNAGGLYVIGAERHDSRRIDNQLIGRSGRQGDPGESRFYLSLDDNLLRIFASQNLVNRMKTSLKFGESLQLGLITKLISKAQKTVEQHYFDIRKNLLVYDNVINKQRKVVYSQRQYFLKSKDFSTILSKIRFETFYALCSTYLGDFNLTSSDFVKNITALKNVLQDDFLVEIDLHSILKKITSDSHSRLKNLKLSIVESIIDIYKSKLNSNNIKTADHLEKVILIKVLDLHWQEHLQSLEYLKNGIGFFSYAQKDPKNEYSKEAFRLFTNMLYNFKYDFFSKFVTLGDNTFSSLRKIDKNFIVDLLSSNEGFKKLFQEKFSRVGYNDNCPCGSKKKYKICHGRQYNF